MCHNGETNRIRPRAHRIVVEDPAREDPHEGLAINAAIRSEQVEAPPLLAALRNLGDGKAQASVHVGRERRLLQSLEDVLVVVG